MLPKKAIKYVHVIVLCIHCAAYTFVVEISIFMDFTQAV